jgi:hypothetical protein
MPRGGKQAGTRNLASRKRLGALSTFLDPSRKLSIRSCLYRLSAMTGADGKKRYEGTDHDSYRSLKELIRTARMASELDDECFIDNKRILLEGETNGWNNIGGYMRPPDVRHYQRNPWQDQPDRIQVWVEKDTLRGLIAQVCQKWDVTRLISMGTFGRTSLLRVAQLMNEATTTSVHRRIWILYIGDFDPTGLAIEEWAQQGNDGEGNRRTEGLRELLVTKYRWTETEYREHICWKRVAVTEADFQNPRLGPYKISIKDAGRDEETGKCRPGHGPRADAYKQQYGGQCLEAEALEILSDGERQTRAPAQGGAGHVAIAPTPARPTRAHEGRGCRRHVGADRLDSSGVREGTTPQEIFAVKKLGRGGSPARDAIERCVNMENVAGGKTKNKKRFVLREVPLWVNQRQNWISDGARRLYQVLRTLADAKTGELFIPGRGWIRLRTIEQKAGMCDETRKKYTRELVRLGAIAMHRDYVTRRINGRNLKVKGQMQITVLPLRPPNPHEQQVPPTAKNSKVEVLPPQERVSPTAKNAFEAFFGIHLQPNPPTVGDFGPPVLSYITTKASAVAPQTGLPENGSPLGRSERSERQDSPAKKPASLTSQTEPEPCPECGSLDTCDHKKAEIHAITQALWERLEENDRREAEARDEAIRRERAEREARLRFLHSQLAMLTQTSNTAPGEYRM